MARQSHQDHLLQAPQTELHQILAKMSSTEASRIVSAQIDGRSRSPRYIQHQLSRLHESLTSHATALLNAITADSGADLVEAEIEFSLAVGAVRNRYCAFDVPRAIDDEYSVAQRRDWASRTTPVGIVYIKPQSHTLLFSTIAPLSNAIAAGNCVVVEVSVLGCQKSDICTAQELASRDSQATPTDLDGISRPRYICDSE